MDVSWVSLASPLRKGFAFPALTGVNIG
jgi:hypothetical protein